MWSASAASLPSVLIVENDSGSVFIVENKKSKSQVEKILKTENASSPSRRKGIVKVETIEQPPLMLK